MEFYTLVLGILATWRLTHLVSSEDGPWEFFARLRRLAGTGIFAELLNCFYCLSFWIAAPLAVLLAHSWKERFLLWLALSAAAILLERVTSAREHSPAPIYFEDPDNDLENENQENQHVLRK